MTKTYLLTLLALAGVCAATPAVAQPEDGGGAPSSDTVFFLSNMAPVMSFGGTVDVVGPEGNVLGPVVAGKPYSADAITESTQVLADGNRITQRNETRVFRDGEGRTRREQRLTGVGPWSTASEPVTIITISDPVADVSYFLDPVARTARQSPAFRTAVGAQATWEMAVPPPPGGEAAGVTIMRDVRIATPAAPVPGATFEAPLPPPPRLGALPQIAGFPPTAMARTAALVTPFANVTEDLGEQILEGVLTRGTRHTQTIPAGALGNERAIEIVAEQWYSAELGALVQRRNYDPRFGESTYRLVNVVRNEPSPDLFTVPSGYEVVTLRGPQMGLRAMPPPGPNQRVERGVFLVQPEPAPAGRDAD